MSPVTAACPSCGAAVEFRFDDSFVRVCAYCNAVVARGDRGFQSLGRMGDLAQSESPLALAVGGQLGAVGFQLIGRAQIAHARGGGWEEWYARFDNGTWGWISEAQGRFQLSFSAGQPAGLPPFESLRPGQAIQLSLPDRPPETFIVSEIGEATYRAAAGELPYQLVPGLRFRYADLSGDRGSTATIDAGVEAGDWVAFFVGREVSLADLGIAAAAPVPGMPPAPGERAGQKVSAVHVACVQCGGSLELRAPDRALRVTCGYCGALLDVNQGHLSYLRTLERDTQMIKPEIPLGSTVDVEQPALTVIGCLRRSVHIDGIDYPFSEYLLYHPALGYRWLVDSDNHWSYVTPLPAGEAALTGTGVQQGGRRYRHFQTSDARVDRIFGEFYWKVELGETVQMVDYVSPPFMLSSEQAESEINWSRAVWMHAAELSRHIRPPGAEAGSLHLQRAYTVAPHQPFRHRGMFAIVAVLAALLVAAAIAIASRSPDRAIPLVFDPPLDSPGPATTPAPDPLELAGAGRRGGARLAGVLQQRIRARGGPERLPRLPGPARQLVALHRRGPGQRGERADRQLRRPARVVSRRRGRRVVERGRQREERHPGRGAGRALRAAPRDAVAGQPRGAGAAPRRAPGRLPRPLPGRRVRPAAPARARHRPPVVQPRAPALGRERSPVDERRRR